MIIEAAVITALAIIGMTIIFAVGLRGWAIVPVGFITGICAIVLTGFFQILTGMPTTPRIAFVLWGLLTLLYWLRFCLLNKPKPKPKTMMMVLVVPLIIFIGTLVVYKIVTPFTHLSHVDSVEYLAIGSMLEADTLHKGVNLFQLQKRMLGVPYMHAIIGEVGGLYLKTITPILAMATLGSMAWVLTQGLGKLLKNKEAITIFTILGLLLLLTNNRFVMHATYINGHLFFGVLLVLFVCSALLLALKSGISRTATIWLQAITMATMIVTRPEASFIVGLALVPMLTSKAFDRQHKVILLGVFGISIILWQGLLTVLYMDGGQSLPLLGNGERVRFSVWGLAFVGFAALAAIPILYTRIYDKLSRFVPGLTEAGLWLMLAGLYLLRPDILTESVSASIENIVGMWGGWPWLLLATMVFVAAIFTRFTNSVLIRFPVTTFLPLVFVLAYIREGVYRVGGGDSLNRMWMQIVPLAILYIVISFACGKWRSMKIKTTQNA